MGFTVSPCTVATCAIFIAFFPIFLSAGNSDVPASTISAAPAVMPDSISPVSSPPPALSPDISPLFPTAPGGPGLSPSDSSMPLIPSSPSPPNPDAMEAPGPDSAFGPSGLLPDSFSGRVDVPVVLGSAVVALGVLLVIS